MPGQRPPIANLRSRRFGVLALLLFVAQALVPGGYMPAFGRDGPTIVLCTGQGRVEVAAPAGIPGALTHRGEHKGDDHPPPCPYAALGGPIAPPDLPALARAPVVPPAAPVVAGAGGVRAAGLASPPPPSTGPPLRA